MLNSIFKERMPHHTATSFRRIRIARCNRTIDTDFSTVCQITNNTLIATRTRCSRIKITVTCLINNSHIRSGQRIQITSFALIIRHTMFFTPLSIKRRLIPICSRITYLTCSHIHTSFSKFFLFRRCLHI